MRKALLALLLTLAFTVGAEEEPRFSVASVKPIPVKLPLAGAGRAWSPSLAPGFRAGKSWESSRFLVDPKGWGEVAEFMDSEGIAQRRIRHKAVCGGYTPELLDEARASMRRSKEGAP